MLPLLPQLGAELTDLFFLVPDSHKLFSFAALLSRLGWLSREGGNSKALMIVGVLPGIFQQCENILFLTGFLVIYTVFY